MISDDRLPGTKVNSMNGRKGIYSFPQHWLDRLGCHEGGLALSYVPLCWKLKFIDEDPKDGELYLEWRKPGETLVDVLSRANVQIAGGIWV